MGKNLVSIPVFYGLQLEVMAVLVEDASLNTATGNLDIFSFWKAKYASRAFKRYDRTHYIIQAPASSYNLSYAVKSPMFTSFCKCAHLTDNRFSFFLPYLILLPH